MSLLSSSNRRRSIIVIMLAAAGLGLWALSRLVNPGLPVQERRANPVAATNCVTPVTVVILGASYAKGWSPAFGSIRIVNAGREGDESWQMLERFEHDVLSNQPRAVILWGFINDIFRSRRGDIAATLSRTRATITKMVEMSQERSIEPVLATEVTIRGPKTWRETAGSLLARLLRRQSYQDYINAHVSATNVWIRDLAASRKIALLDFERALAATDGRRQYEFAADDGSHVSADGYEALTDFAMPVLAERFCGQ
jgi:lysophospholipase L1-like esterase